MFLLAILTRQREVYNPEFKPFQGFCSPEKKTGWSFNLCISWCYHMQWYKDKSRFCQVQNFEIYRIKGFLITRLQVRSRSLCQPHLSLVAEQTKNSDMRFRVLDWSSQWEWRGSSQKERQTERSRVQSPESGQNFGFVKWVLILHQVEEKLQASGQPGTHRQQRLLSPWVK